MTEPEDIQFNPPYTLKGAVAVSFAVMRSDRDVRDHFPAGAGDFKVIRLAKFVPVMVVSSHWDPHPQRPVPYNELIVSVFGWYRSHFYSVPLALYLDDPFHVDLGRRHYHLPKHLVPDLVVALDQKKITVDSTHHKIHLNFLNSVFQILLWPLTLLFSAAVATGTTILPLLGISGKPFIQAKIKLLPQCWSGKFASAISFRTQFNEKITPLISIVWPRTTSKISIPKNL